MPDLVEQKLTEALRAGEASRWAAALGLVLDAWRARRSPVLGELVDRLSHRVAGEPVVTHVGAWHFAWLAREEARRPADLASLLRALVQPKGSCTWELALARVERLAGWPDDPRIALGLLDHLEDPPFIPDGVADVSPFLFFRRMGHLIVRTADARALDRIRDLRRSGCRGFVAKQAEPSAVETLAGLEAAWRAGPPALEPGEAALVEAIGTRSRASRAMPQDLSARVFADPDADEPRRAYAAALVARGDPRGTFIQLELRRHAGETLSTEDEASARALQEAHGPALLGDLAPALDPRWVRFERGFPVAGSLRQGADPARRFCGHPAWSTLRELDFQGEEPGLAHPVLHRLRAVAGLRDADLLIFATTEAGASLEELGCLGPSAIEDRWSEATRRALTAPDALPRLRRLDVGARDAEIRRDVGQLRWLWDTPVARRLTAFSAATGAESFAPWLAQLAEHAPWLSTFELRPGPRWDSIDLTVRATQGPEGRLSALEALVGPRRDGTLRARREALEALASVLRALPPGSLTQLHIEGDRDARPEPEPFRVLAEALLAHRRWVDAASRVEITARLAWYAERRVPRRPEVTVIDQGSGERRTMVGLTLELVPDRTGEATLVWAGQVLAIRGSMLGVSRMSPIQADGAPSACKMAVDPGAEIHAHGRRFTIAIEDVDTELGRLPAPAPGMDGCRFCRQAFGTFELHPGACTPCAERYLGFSHPVH